VGFLISSRRAGLVRGDSSVYWGLKVLEQPLAWISRCSGFAMAAWPRLLRDATYNRGRPHCMRPSPPSQRG